MNKLSKYKPKSDTQEVAYSYHHFHNENVRIWVLAYFELEIFSQQQIWLGPQTCHQPRKQCPLIHFLFHISSGI